MRVPGARVETTGDDQQLRTVRVERRHDDALERRLEGAGTRARREGQVDVRAPAVALAGLLDRTGPGRVAVGLVQGDRQYGRIVVEGQLRAVAVVGIPVDDGDAFEAVRLPGMERSEGRIPEDAAPHPLVGERVVSRRADQRVGVVVLTPQDDVDRRQASTRRKKRDLVARAVNRGALTRIASSPVAQLLYAQYVLLRVEAKDLVERRGPRSEPIDELSEPAHLDQAVDPADALGRLRVRAWLDHLAGRDDRRSRAGIVPEEALVIDEGSAAGASARGATRDRTTRTHGLRSAGRRARGSRRRSRMA